MAPSGCGRCGVFLAGALVLDLAGLALVLAGTVGRPTLEGRLYEDFLALSGGLLLFLSLLLWLSWYSGNLRGVADEELPLHCRPNRPPSGPGHAAAAAPRSHASLLRLAAKLSERLSQRPRRPASVTVPVRPPEQPLELSPRTPQAHTAERLV